MTSRKLHFLVFLSIILVDQIVKFIVLSNNFRHIVNKGISFGLLGQLNISFQLVFPIILILIFLALYFLQKTKNIYTCSAILLILSGGISNLLDRLIYSGVIDYIQLWVFPVFNIADIAIVLGIAVFILYGK